MSKIDYRIQLKQSASARAFTADCNTAINRKGAPETFKLLSLPIGIVDTGITPVGSYVQLASLSTETKKLAKKQGGSAIIVNRKTDPHHIPKSESTTSSA